MCECVCDVLNVNINELWLIFTEIDIKLDSGLKAMNLAFVWHVISKIYYSSVVWKK